MLINLILSTKTGMRKECFQNYRITISAGGQWYIFMGFSHVKWSINIMSTLLASLSFFKLN